MHTRSSMGYGGMGMGLKRVLTTGNANLFFRMGVSLGSRSLMGGVIFVIPITFTIAYSPKEKEKNTFR